MTSWCLRSPNEDDRDLLMLLGSVGIRVSEIVTGLLEDSLSCDEQIVFGQQLMDLAEGFRQRVLRQCQGEEAFEASVGGSLPWSR